MNKDDFEIIALNPMTEAKKRMKSYTRTQLLGVIHGELPNQNELKVALLLLDEMNITDSENKHKEILTVAKSANNWAMWAVIVGVLSLLVLLKDCKGLHSPVLPPSIPKTEELKYKPEQRQSSIAVVEPENDASSKQPLQPKSINK